MKKITRIVLSLVCVLTLFTAKTYAEEVNAKIIHNAPSVVMQTNAYTHQFRVSASSLHQSGKYTDVIQTVIIDPNGKTELNQLFEITQGSTGGNYYLYGTADLKGKYRVIVRVITYKGTDRTKPVQSVSSESYITVTDKVSADIAKTGISSISRGKTTLTVKWKKNSKLSGYQIRYSTSYGMSNAKFTTITSYKKTSKKLTGLKRKKTYYVQIRSYKKIKGIKVFSEWSAKKTVKTK